MDNLKINTLQVCRTCMEEITQVNTELTIRQKLSNCIPLLDLSIVQNVIICGTCADSINFVYNFKNKCLQVELQILKYVQQLQHTGDVDLAEFAQFIQLHYRNLSSTEIKTEDIEVTENSPTLLSNDTAFNEGDHGTQITNNKYLLSLEEVMYNDDKDIHLDIKTCVCRTCMEEIVNIPFFHLDSIQVNTEPTIRQKLCNCIPELNLSIVRNAIICSTCADTINFVYNFKNKCLQLELQIHKYIQQLQHTGDVDLAEVAWFNQLHYRNLSIELKTKDIEVPQNFKYHQEAPTLLNDDTAFNDIDKDTESTNNQYLMSLQKVDTATDCVLFNTVDVLFNYNNPVKEENLNTHDNSNILQDRITQMVDNGDCNIPDLGRITQTFYECYTCGHKTKSKSKLILHMTAYMVNKRFKCSVCEYRCNYRCGLKQHMLIHPGEKPFSCSFCEYQCKRKYDLKMHMLIHTNDKPFTCLVCEYKFRVKCNLKSHMLKHTGEKRFTCSVCECKCKRKSELKQHMKIHTGEERYTCSLCEYQCVQKGNLKRHMQIHTDARPFTCSVCQHKCKCKSDLKKHIEIHIGEKRFTCSVCEHQSIKKSNLNIHMKIHTDDKPFTCSICEYQCKRKSSLKMHMRIHSEEKSFRCSFCEYQSRYKDALKLHIMQNQTGEKRFACSVCEYRCLRKSNIKRHMQIHTGSKPFACSACEYRSTTKSTLKRHMLTHTVEKPFSCSLCERQYKEKNSLKRHMQIHAGSPFACSVCEYKCVQKRSLKIHMQIHTGNTLFTCSVCEYHFREKSSLKRHMQMHTADKPFTCSVCEYKCIRKSSLNTHMKRHTN